MLLLISESCLIPVLTIIEEILSLEFKKLKQLPIWMFKYLLFTVLTVGYYKLTIANHWKIIFYSSFEWENWRSGVIDQGYTLLSFTFFLFWATKEFYWLHYNRQMKVGDGPEDPTVEEDDIPPTCVSAKISKGLHNNRKLNY